MSKTSNWLTIENKSDNTETVELTIEGIIGSWWKDNEEAILRKEEMQNQLKQIAEIKAKHIIVNINSYGGDVNHGVSIHDLLANHSAQVTTIVNGHTASAATIIAQAGNVRKMSANALFLIHNASTIAYGDKNELKVALDDIEKVDKTISEIYAKRTGKTAEEIKEQMNKFNGRGEWMTADEAKAFGLVDEVYEPMKAAAFIDKEILSRYGLPEFPENKINFNKTENTMKKFILTNMPVLAALFNVKVTDEVEASPENFQKANDELQLRADNIIALTAERDTLKSENAALTAAKTKAEDELENANKELSILKTSNDTLTSENSELKKNAGAKTATSVVDSDKSNDEGVDPDVKYCSEHSIAENVAYLRNKRKAK